MDIARTIEISQGIFQSLVKLEGVLLAEGQDDRVRISREALSKYKQCEQKKRPNEWVRKKQRIQTCLSMSDLFQLDEKAALDRLLSNIDQLNTINAAALTKLDRLKIHVPLDAELFFLRGLYHQNTGFREGANIIFSELAGFHPKNPELFTLLFRSCMHNKDFQVARLYKESDLEIGMKKEEVLVLFSELLIADGKVSEGIAKLKQAEEINAGSPVVLRQYVHHFHNIGEYKLCTRYGEKLIQTSDVNSADCTVIGASYRSLGFLETSIQYLKKSFELNPVAKCAFSLGNVYSVQGNDTLSTYWLQMALILNPEHYASHYALFFSRMKSCHWENREEDENRIREMVERHLNSKLNRRSFPCLAFNYFDFPIFLHQQINKYNSRKIEHLLKPVQVDSSRQVRTKCGRLRVGYISPDLRDHPVGRIVSGIFPRHNKEKFHLTAYSLYPFHMTDEYSRKIQEATDLFRDLSQYSFQEAATIIKLDEIDILIDLAGHTALAKPEILARKPAPVQLHFLGYPSTTGMAAIDYLIADEILVPRQLARFYSEEILYLPHAFVGSRVNVNSTELTRKELELPSGSFVFAAIHKPQKIEPEIFDCWMKILLAVENSVLLLSNLPPQAKENLELVAKDYGIEGCRLVYKTNLPYLKYIKSYQLADLFLDTWHYSAGSTLIDALSAGLPAITCVGETNASRMGASIIAAAGLDDLICENLDEYANKAIELAKSPDLLLKYRSALDLRSPELPLFDFASFTQRLEALYQDIGTF